VIGFIHAGSKGERVENEVVMAVWKVSYVIEDSSQAGGIINLYYAPKPGEIIGIGNDQLEVLEVFELIPPSGEFHYLHATCRLTNVDE
jgi:hypothetical protein